MKKSNFAHFIKEIKKAVYSYITTLQYTKAYVSRQDCESFTVSWAAGTNQAVQKFNLSVDILKYITYYLKNSNFNKNRNILDGWFLIDYK